MTDIAKALNLLAEFIVVHQTRLLCLIGMRCADSEVLHQQTFRSPPGALSTLEVGLCTDAGQLQFLAGHRL